jgi:hypothetical protein
VLSQEYIVKTAAEELFYNFGGRGKDIRPKTYFLEDTIVKFFVKVSQQAHLGFTLVACLEGRTCVDAISVFCNLPVVNRTKNVVTNWIIQLSQFRSISTCQI